MYQLLRNSIYNKVIFLLMISSALFADKYHNNYDIGDCKIAIPKSYNLVNQNTKYEYNFLKTQIFDNKILFNKIVISNKKKNDYYNILQISKNKKNQVNLISEYQYKGFKIIIQEIDSEILLYNLFGKNSKIFITGDNIEPSMVNNLIDSCFKEK